MTGVATAFAINQQTSAEVKLKWPNDILLNGKKIAGILCECINIGESNPSVIVGIGINLNQTEFPDALHKIATSLKLETGNDISREDITLSLIHSLNLEYAEFLEGNRESLIRKWTEHSDLIGKTVTVDQKEKKQVGKVLGISHQGKLILQTPEGKQQLLDSGELLAAEANDN